MICPVLFLVFVLVYDSIHLKEFFYYIVPYLIVTLGFVIAANKEMAKKTAEKESGEGALIRFMDIYLRPKLIIAPSAVLFIEAKENYVVINYLEGDRVKKFELRATMSSLEGIAAKHNFIRCQRSFYINPSHVTVLRKETGGLVYAELDEPGLPTIPVSKRYYEDLAKFL